MGDRANRQRRGQGKQPDSGAAQSESRKSSRTAETSRAGQTAGGGKKPEYPTGPADVAGTSGGVALPTGEPGGPGVTGDDTRTRRDVGSKEGIETGAGLNPSATTRSEERDTGSAPGSRDDSHVSDLGETGMEGASGGSAGITGVSGSTGVVGRPPGMSGEAGVAGTTGNAGGSSPSGRTPGGESTRGTSGNEVRRTKGRDKGKGQR